MRLRFILITLLFMHVASIARNASAMDLGIWSWSQANFATPEARDKMLSFCVAEGISHLDQHVSITRTEEGYRLRNTDALKQLLIASAAKDVSVNALRGERNMFFGENHDRAYAQLEAIIAFNRDLPAGSRFAGIKYDVEPYLTDEWRAGGKSREKVIRDYLSFLTQAKKLLTQEGSNLDLCVDIPFWWDKPEFASSLNGKDKLLIHHIIDLTDWIGIMSYRQEATDVIRLTKEEFDYATRIKKPQSIAPAINTVAVKGDEDWTSFGGASVAHLRKTITELQSRLADNKAARCVMIHDYKGLVNFLKEAPEELPALPGTKAQ